MQKIKKGDNVKILIGKDSGRSGAVESVLVKKGQVLVSGINMYKRSVSGKRVGVSEGGIIEIRKPVNLSNVVLVCPNCKMASRVGFRQEADKMVRFCKKCQKEIKQ